jgi:hypothetical protein
MTGHCYVASEALYHLLGGPRGGWTPMFVRHEGESHWFLRDRQTGRVLDPTADPFKGAPDYTKARGKGFLTRGPSQRARVVIKRCMW